MLDTAHDLAAQHIIVALDCAEDEALAIAQELKGSALWLKVGMTLFYTAGPRIVHTLRDMGFKVFLDLKLHDIPHQVQGAAYAASKTGADLLSVHGLGGTEMIRAAREGVDRADLGTKIVAISVLTSMDEKNLESIGITRNVKDEVSALAHLSIQAGADGMVCSPQEVAVLRKQIGTQPWLVTPGVRPKTNELADQKRVATPKEAYDLGASHLVIGRPITQAHNRLQAFEAIVQELENRL